jgi:hypothetical protein
MAKMRDGAQWLSNHYAANDYYCEGEHVVGSWAGKGTEFFGIIGQQIEPQKRGVLAALLMANTRRREAEAA